MERLGTTLLVDQRPHEGPLAAVAGAVEHGLGEGAGRTPDTGAVTFVDAGHQVDQAREGAGELQGDREEGAYGRGDEDGGLRGKAPPPGRLGQRRGGRAPW
jgi:hypothetical protein